jgi:hypothetical protein
MHLPWAGVAAATAPLARETRVPPAFPAGIRVAWNMLNTPPGAEPRGVAPAAQRARGANRIGRRHDVDRAAAAAPSDACAATQVVGSGAGIVQPESTR